jgi:hypothetical protein
VAQMKKYFTPSPTFLLPPPSIYSEAQSQNTSISTSLLYPNPAQTTLHALLGNNEQIQDLKSTSCGYFCIFVLDNLLKGRLYNDVINDFTLDNYEYNEGVLKKYFIKKN